MNNFPEIHTENYLLRQIVAGDLENIHRGLSDAEVTRYYDIRFDSLEATKEQLAWYADLEQTETGIWWAISSEDKKTFFGAIGICNRNFGFKKADLGFWLLPEFWKKGIINEVVPSVLRFCFEGLQLNRIEAQVEAENSACRKTMEKSGFVCEGILREYEIKDDRKIDLAIYSRLKSD